MTAPRIAVVGASVHRHKFGNKCVRAYREAGFEVFPVNPHHSEIEGLTAYASLHDLPHRPDRISVYLPPAITRTLLPTFAAFPEAEVWFNPGAADREVLAAARNAGIEVRDGCSIVDIGLSPSQFR